VYAASADNVRHPQPFRAYPIRGLSVNATIVEAICATMSIPSHFLAVKIGRIQRRFVGGPLGANNPTAELLKEAENAFGNEKRLVQIVSIGCGVPPALSVEALISESGAGRLLREIPTECETIAKDLGTRLINVDAYLRLSVEKEIGQIEMTNWASLEEIETHTACYVETPAVIRALERSLKRLKERVGTVTVAQLSKCITCDHTVVPNSS